MAKAEKLTRVHATAIGDVASGKKVTAGGFAWAWGDAPNLDINSIIKARKEKHRMKYGQKVSQYNFNGNKIAQFPSLQHASEATGIHSNQILLVVKGVYKSAKGFFWKKGYGKDKIDLSNHKWGKASMGITQSKKVRQFSMEGKYIRTFSSVKEAAQYIGVASATLSAALNGGQKSSGGYIWKFA
jgi:hypothetical protein